MQSRAAAKRVSRSALFSVSVEAVFQGGGILTKVVLRILAVTGSIIGLLLVTSSPILAKTIVIQSSGPSAGQFPPGRVLAEPLSIDLRSGDMVKVLDGAGTRVLTGPKKVRDSAARPMANDSRISLASLMTAQAARRNRTGAVRGTGSDPDEASGAAPEPANSAGQSNLWNIDPMVAGDWCVRDPDEVMLWRENAEEGARLTVNLASGSGDEARWPKGANLMYWPANLPVGDGARYFLQVDSNQGNFVTLHFIDEDEDLVKLAGALEANKCDFQFDMLVADAL